MCSQLCTGAAVFYFVHGAFARQFVAERCIRGARVWATNIGWYNHTQAWRHAHGSASGSNQFICCIVSLCVVLSFVLSFRFVTRSFTNSHLHFSQIHFIAVAAVTANAAAAVVVAARFGYRNFRVVVRRLHCWTFHKINIIGRWLRWTRCVIVSNEKRAASHPNRIKKILVLYRYYAISTAIYLLTRLTHKLFAKQ